MDLPPPPLPHCTRHPERVTGRSCTRCGRPACGDCLVQADVGSKCIDCVRRDRPAARTRVTYWNASQPILVTKTIIAINFLVFVYTNLGGMNLGGGGHISDNSIHLGLYKGFLYNGEWYRLITSGFLHFGIFHIAMNMLLLYQLGNLLERVIGSGRLLALYAAGLFAGSLGVLVADTIQGAQNSGITGGASGAVFGLMAAAAIGMHRRGINVFRTGIGTTLMLNLVLTFAITGVSVGGHLGGLAGRPAASAPMSPAPAPASSLCRLHSPR